MTTSNRYYSTTINTGYSTRDTNLQVLEYDNYAQYLLSNLWKVIRTKVLVRDKYQCQVCKRRVEVLKTKQKIIRVATQVHHIGYSLGALTGTKPYLLVSLCPKCHKEIEYEDGGKGIKRQLTAAITKTIYLISGKLKNAGGSDKSIGLWYRDREEWDEELGTAKAIRKELQRRFPAILTKYAKWWNEVDQPSTYVKSQLTAEQLDDFYKLVKRKYRGKVEIMKLEYNDSVYGKRLQVVIDNTTRWVWNEDQIEELLK